MGLMDQLPMPADPGRLIVTPHPVLLDGQRNVAADLRPGESLYAFLQRHVDGLDGQAWAVSIGGREVPRHLWHCVYPKHGQVIEVRGAVGKSALALVAVIALTYFTFGFGTATAGMWGAGAVSSAWGGLAATGVYMAGSMLINKVLAPKLGSATSTAESVYSLSSAQNRARPYEPLGLLFGAIRVTPDLASAPYTWFEGDDQYLGMTLTPGLNVDRIDALYNGDTLLSSYEGVTVWHSGYSGMPEQTIPLYSNADTAQGGTLIDTSTDPKHTAGAWIERTSSADTIRLQVDIEFRLFDTHNDGKPKQNNETFNLQYRPTGSSTWLTWGNFAVSNSTQKTRRATYGLDVALGQYDVRVRVQGQNTDGKGASCNATWNTLTSIQQDTASYAGIPRTGIKIKATRQLNGALQEVRGKAYAKPLQLWDGSAWKTVTAPGADGISNPGAQILYYARGIRDGAGTLIAGMGLDDDMIDIEALKAFMAYCAANGYTYDYWITDARSHSDVLDKIALNGMGEITWAGGKLSVVWAGAEQPLSGVVNMATIKKGSFQVDYALANAADGIEYSYTDPDTLETKTLRVPAPGITTMLNPAQVAGEGITSEQHAARMARWHLAQSLYQYKSIGYDTDLEHLSYRRLSVLALQHDLTQWGYGGRVRAAANAGGTVTLTLDEPVPAPAAGNAYIGLRIPGEAIYRVFAIQPFAGETTTITLADAWPDDAEVPGNRDGNPAWDTIWIYDFKQTPGYRVRVTGIEPESDLKGASISVVPEGPEFWTYVLTGAYTPAPNQSLLPTRPVASNLRVTERNVIQGDTVYTELQVTFDISGRAVNTVVSCDVDGDGQLDEVAQTVTRSASFRIPGAGSYTILVRPYDEDGNAGVPATIIYVTASADQPPVLVDSFTVDAIDGGLRRYTWGFNPDTIQSPDFAGVEIRYTAGAATAPDWNNMTPLGDSGFHTAAFESTAPTGGEWTFACRSRNTSGTLSDDYKLLTVTLGSNLGETITEQTQALTEAQAAIDHEVADRLQGDLDTQATAAADATAKADAAVATAAADATAKANAARDDAYAYADVIGAQVADITGADEWSSTKDYPSGDLVKSGGKLYRALQNVPAGTAVTNTAYWQLIGNYSSLGEAVAASISIGNQNTSDIGAESTRIDAVTARMPSGTGTLATSAQVATEATARANADTALSNRTTALEATVGDATTGNVALSQAITDVSATASAKNKTYAQTTAPATGMTAGDMWIDTDDGNKLYRYSGSGWVAYRDTAYTSKNRTWVQTSPPTSLAVGDLWFDSDDNNKQYRAASVGATTIAAGKWVAVDDIRIAASAAAITAINARLPSGTGMLATADSLSSLATDVAQIGNTTSSNSTAITSLSNEITTARNGASSLDNRLDGIDTTVASKASASALSALQSTVTSQGNTINSHTSSITSLNSTVAGKADASTVSALQSQVTSQGNTISAQGTALTAVKAQLTGSANLAPNAALESDLTGWAIGWDSAGAGFQLYRDRNGFVYPGGRHVLGIATDATVPAGSFVSVTGARFPVDGGRRYCIQGKLNTPGNTNTDFGVIFYNASGVATEAATAYTGPLNWDDCLVFKTAPADAVEAVVWIRGYTQTSITNVSMGATNIMVSAATVDQTAAAPWSPPVAGIDSKYAGVTQSMQAQVTSQGNTIAAQGTALTAVEARMPDGNGELATSASVIDEATARAQQDQALGERIGVVEARMPDGNGELATSASVIDEATARAQQDQALGERIGVVEARMPAGNGGLATSASVIDEATARAQQDQALGERIGVVETALPGKADASAVSALQSQVTSQGNTLTAQGTALTAVKAQLTGSANLAPNAALESDLTGWVIGWDSAGAGFQLYRDRYGWVYPGGRHVFGIATDATVPAGSFISVNGARFPIDGGKRYCIQGRLGVPSNTDITFGLIFYNSAGTATEAGTNYVGALNWSDCLTFKTAPADAVEAVVWFRGHTNAAIAGVAFSAVNIMVSAATADQTVAAPWSPPVAGIDSKYASVTQSMQAQVTSQGNNITSILAQYFLAVNAGGKVAGMKIGSNGTTGSVEFLADIFRVIASGNAGMEWQANYLRTYGTGFQFIIGAGFGANGDLAAWFGANIGAANCTQANGLFVLTTSGGQIIRSSLTGARVETVNGTVNVYDTSNVRRVRMGVW